MALRNFNWNSVTYEDDPQLAYNNFEENFNTLYNLYFPISLKKTNRNFSAIEDWMSKGILISRKEKIRLFSEYKSKMLDSCLIKYKNYRNLYNKIIRKAKILHYEKLFTKSKFNLKQTWTLFNKAINKKPKKTKKTLPQLSFKI